jgi:hypothetical protein
MRWPVYGIRRRHRDDAAADLVPAGFGIAGAPLARPVSERLYGSRAAAPPPAPPPGRR